jgi:hypothetical protein
MASTPLSINTGSRSYSRFVKNRRDEQRWGCVDVAIHATKHIPAISLASRQRYTCVGPLHQVAPADLSSTDACGSDGKPPSPCRHVTCSTTLERDHHHRRRSAPAAADVAIGEAPRNAKVRHFERRRTITMAAVRTQRRTGRAPRRCNTCGAPEDPHRSSKYVSTARSIPPR